MVSGLDVFFYGLFMDPDLLAAKGLDPGPPRVGSVAGLELRIGRRASLAPRPGARTFGVVMRLIPDEIERLYAESSVREYEPATVVVELERGGTVEARCYTLPVPPTVDERNAVYAAQLRIVAAKVGLPAAYVESIGR
jgi:Gamma-glutamyl cyclotransferase, AIG2-like